MEDAGLSTELKSIKDFLSGYEETLTQPPIPQMKAVAWVKNNMTKAALAYGVAVQAKQWISLPLAGAYLPQHLLLKNMSLYAGRAGVWGKGSKALVDAQEQMYRYAPELYYRAKGGATVHELGKRTQRKEVQWAWGVKPSVNTSSVSDFGMSQLQKRDSEVVAAIWATAVEVSNGDMQAAAKLAEKTVRRTQPTNEYKDKTNIARYAQGKPFLQLWLTFSTVTQKILLMQKRTIVKGMYGQNLWKTLYDLGATMFISSVLPQLIDFIRDKLSGRRTTLKDNVTNTAMYALSPSLTARAVTPFLEDSFNDLIGNDDAYRSDNLFNSNLVSSSMKSILSGVQKMMSSKHKIGDEFSYGDDFWDGASKAGISSLEVLSGLPVRRSKAWAVNSVNWSKDITDHLNDKDRVRIRDVKRKLRLKRKDLYKPTQNMDGVKVQVQKNVYKDNLETLDIMAEAVINDEIISALIISEMFVDADGNAIYEDSQYKDLSFKDKKKFIKSIYREGYKGDDAIVALTDDDVRAVENE